MDSKAILVTGATGYVGGRLVPRLLDAGYRVKAFGRSMEKLRCRPWGNHPNVEIIQGDMLHLPSVEKAANGCRTVFYLVHSMMAQKGRFSETDRKAAENLKTAAAQANIERIIYLGGLGGDNGKLASKHLRSRHEVGNILQSGSVPTTVLRAAMILGSGSASFEILRYLVEHLPVMITPKWVSTACQPISIGDVLSYLEGCLETDAVLGQTLDIGGPDVLNYRDIIRIYAEEAGLPKRRIIPIPLLSPTLSAYWIHLITPVPASIAMPLTEGLSVPVTCKDNRILNMIPFERHSCRETIRIALDRIHQEQVDTCWADAGCLIPPEWAYCGDADYSGGTILECGYKIRLNATPDEVWKPVSEIGGKSGWYFADFLWWIRGLGDRLMGGIGIRRGRRHPSQLQVGDALDFWRVLDVAPPDHLRLLAEMKTPGEALLEFKITPMGNNQTELQQLSRFLPKGIGGILYWYILYPFHELIFGGMLRSIAKKIGKPVARNPERFTPKLRNACALPQAIEKQS